jgi:hypothetical protein
VDENDVGDLDVALVEDVVAAAGHLGGGGGQCYD